MLFEKIKTCPSVKAIFHHCSYLSCVTDRAALGVTFPPTLSDACSPNFTRLSWWKLRKPLQGKLCGVVDSRPSMNPRGGKSIGWEITVSTSGVQHSVQPIINLQAYNIVFSQSYTLRSIPSYISSTHLATYSYYNIVEWFPFGCKNCSVHMY